ncbi:hypothetical protein GCM10011390_50210 [Aureimonas endophytica]|uniref:Uncharacterized protein n=1 Tax=Aureimonas endophytica TaxID=2027858 RepID=A0A917EE80_9HYPH|nr:hypothetical protein [Aureimonas endophytica]GGE24735.1 hypothetical protein GCM10011390_50210 [Aureimonas endophytica]
MQLLQAEFGTVFPPRDEYDVLAYDLGDVCRGYRRFSADDPMPGENHAAGFRWGWQNRMRDCQLGDDGFDEIRHMARLLQLMPEPAERRA